MGKVVTAQVGANALEAFPSLAGVCAGDDVRSEEVFGPHSAHERPLFLWMHHLPDGASIDFNGAPVDHLLFVRKGRLENVEPGGTFLIEHGARASLRVSGATTIAHFHRREDRPPSPSRPGGGVEIIAKDAPQGWDQRTGMLYRIFHDSRRKTSDVWFHRTDFPEGHKGVPHLHTTDELILVIDGEMRVGTQHHPAGTALAIDANTVYSFSAGAPSLAFVNFRAEHSERIGVTRNGRTPPMEEADFLRSLPSPPPGGWTSLRAPTDTEREGGGAPHYLDIANS